MTTENKAPAKLDLKKQLKHLYLPSAREVSAVDVPEMRFIVVDGQIEPNATPGTSPGLAEAIGALYGQGYAFHGRHHEIYLGDPRTAKPENLKTVLRRAVVRAE